MFLLYILSFLKEIISVDSLAISIIYDRVMVSELPEPRTIKATIGFSNSYAVILNTTTSLSMPIANSLPNYRKLVKDSELQCRLSLLQILKLKKT